VPPVIATSFLLSCGTASNIARAWLGKQTWSAVPYTTSTGTLIRVRWYGPSQLDSSTLHWDSQERRLCLI